MARIGIQSGAKLEVVAQLGDGEQALRSSLYKQLSDGGVWQITRPMADSKVVTLPPGTPVLLGWGSGSSWFTLSGTVIGTVKQGVRFYLNIQIDGDVQSVERRSNTRIPAEIPAEVILYDTDRDGSRQVRAFPSTTTDISNGGVALLTNASLAVGEVVEFNLSPPGRPVLPLKAEICWLHDAPKGLGYRNRAGLQFLFTNHEDAMSIVRLTASLAGRR